MKKTPIKLAVAVLCLVQFVDVLGVTEVLTVAPRMLRAVSGTNGAASALLTAYAMCFGGLLMLGARLGDRFGHRRMLLCGIGLFAAGSLSVAIAGSVTVLVAGRCLQGAAAAVSVPASLRLLIAASPRPAERRAAMAAWSAAGAAAGASGFVVGGVLAQITGWRLTFAINLPLSMAIGTGVLCSVAPDRPAASRGLALLTGLLFTAGVAGVVLGAASLEPPGHPRVGLAALTAGVLLAALAAARDRRAATPLIPAPALRLRRLRVGAGAAFLNTATTSSLTAIATLQLQRVQHLSPAAAGLRFLPLSLAAITGAALAAATLRRLSPERTIALGLSLIGMAGAGLIAVHGSGWWISVPVAAAGLGLGLSSVAANALGTDVAQSHQAVATGALNTCAQLGTALGVAALLLLSGATAHAALPLHGPTLGWAAAAGMALAGATAIAIAATGGRRVPRAATGGRRARSAAARRAVPTPRA